MAHLGAIAYLSTELPLLLKVDAAKVHFTITLTIPSRSIVVKANPAIGVPSDIEISVDTWTTISVALTTTAAGILEIQR